MHWTRSLTSCAALSLGLVAQAALAQPAPPPNEYNWWKNAVIYEIYPRSFQDTNNDGIGDINGITRRLDYLQKLGVDAIWLTPIYPSPQVDFGYDISSYESIDPQYGTMADFDRLIAEANTRHIRVLMDMVMNHTSDKHTWFLQSRSSRSNPYRDWYIWRNGKGETATSPGKPPNNWQSVFGGSAWQWDPQTRQYYYHKFYVQQPDLNWNNPKVRAAFEDIMRFWLKRGVGGFRFDAITTLFEDPNLIDEGEVKDAGGKPIINAFGEPELDNTRTDNLPAVHPVMQEMRKVADEFDSSAFPGTRVLIGETYLTNIDALEKEYGSAGKPEFQLPMDTQLGFINERDAATFRQKLIDVEERLGGNTPLIVFDNHDNPRLDLRYGDGVHNEDIERVISTILFASRGASLFYYGDEIGMKTTPPARKEDVKDPVGLRGWPQEKGRDGERTPMQWNPGPNAGFTAAGVKPWLPVSPDYITVNVETEEKDPDSLLAWYRSLIRLKKTNLALAEGSETMLDSRDPDVLAWVRTALGAPRVVVAVNFSAQPKTARLTVAEASRSFRRLLKTPGTMESTSVSEVRLKPYGVYIGEIGP